MCWGGIEISVQQKVRKEHKTVGINRRVISVHLYVK